jgi:hypothetical protein
VDDEGRTDVSEDAKITGMMMRIFHPTSSGNGVATVTMRRPTMQSTIV